MPSQLNCTESISATPLLDTSSLRYWTRAGNAFSASLWGAVSTLVALFTFRCTVEGVETLTHGQVLARFGHALSDPVRARLLLALRESPGYPAELADALGTSRQNLSNHLACLRGCGLVVAVPEGRRTRYELTDPRIAHALGDLLGLVLAVDPAACLSAQRDGYC
jgi:DNA-binding transcriptional ArsR family regulator